MNESTPQRVVLISGVSRGIGRFLAEHYLERSWRVVGVSRGETDLSHRDFIHRRLDVGDEARVKELFVWIRRELGGLDALVNNAGAASLNHFLLTPLETARKVMGSNFLGTFLLSREAAKLMKKRGSGRIVNLSSVAVPLALEGEAAYAASKAAVETLTRVLSRELAEFEITVNAVGPGPVATRLISEVPGEKIERILARQALHRLARFEDVANVIDFFLQPESAMVTGQVIYLGGV